MTCTATQTSCDKTRTQMSASRCTRAYTQPVNKAYNILHCIETRVHRVDRPIAAGHAGLSSAAAHSIAAVVAVVAAAAATAVVCAFRAHTRSVHNDSAIFVRFYKHTNTRTHTLRQTT
jgi:hypothetical protein